MLLTHLLTFTSLTDHLFITSRRDREMAEPAKDPPKKRGPPRKKFVQIAKLVINVIRCSGNKRGTSVVAIKKDLRGQGVDVKKYNTRINRAIVKLRDNGDLVQVRGRGASGSYRLSAKTKDAKPRTAKPRRSASRKPAGSKPRSRKPASSKPRSRKPAGAKGGKRSGGKTGGGRVVKRKSGGGKVVKKTSTTRVRKVSVKKLKSDKSSPRKKAGKTPAKKARTTTPKRNNPKKSRPKTTSAKRGR